ncbi:dextranase [Caloramator quimbayensis]|uniref:Dextranase n=1 Tax=Caloramator quimbayensis TaxID=1147123 RepID=A0A1T4XU09_9CLOT|nr:glycoside hydrolase family 66 protein [Caloramator quimbayensis]SKA93059.1 dextranase [Caloramator quimbayensis]
MKKWITAVISSIILILFIYSVYSIRNFAVDGNNKVLYSGKILEDIYTDKARYNPNDTANINIEVKNTTNKDFNGIVYLYLKHLGKTKGVIKENLSIEKGKSCNIKVTITLPNDDFKGYLIEAYAVKGRKIYDYRNTAVNVSSKWSVFPIYGYITDFPKQDIEKTKKIIGELSKYHINVLQFYDWQDAHHKPLPQDGSRVWKDIAGREIYLDTLKGYIDSAHEKNILAANYNLIYGAYTDYIKDKVKAEWGLYKDNEHTQQDGHTLPSSWESSLCVFNPSNSEWQNYIFNEEKKANSLLNFDIWHMDTLGNRGYLYDYYGNDVDLKSTYSEFIDEALKNCTKEAVFNTVNTYGIDEIAKSGVSILYSELWPSDYLTYLSLKQVIDMGDKLTEGKKKTVIAAYMNYEKAESKGEFNENSVRLCDASIFAAGGSHIELGDTGMLAKEYFPNDNLTMTEPLKNAMRSYYDFLVAYENLLRDGLKEGNSRIEIEGTEVSDKALPNKIWAYSKIKEGYDVIQMINFTGIKYNWWRDDYGVYPSPNFKKDLKLRYYTDDLNVKKVYLASPDINGGKTISLKYKVKEYDGKKYIEINIPELKYWDMIYIER